MTKIRKITYKFQIILCLFALNVNAQNVSDSLHRNIKYYDQEYFLLEGTTFADSLKENRYQRLPQKLKTEIGPAIWNISQSSTGMSIRFWTNSSSIQLKYEVTGYRHQNNMAETGSRGLDIYYKDSLGWHYVRTVRPTGPKMNVNIVSNMSSVDREYKLYLPLYASLVELHVGIDTTASIHPSEANKFKPIVFYGTSITQGGSASRPGSAHTNIISRKTGADCLNFGFNGNGKMDKFIVDYLAQIDASFFIIECLPNMTSEEVSKRTIPLVEVIRTSHPTTPIIFVDNFKYSYHSLDSTSRNEILLKNELLNSIYNKMIWEFAWQDIYLLNVYDELDQDQEGTVDGVHFNALGFSRYAEFLKSKLDYYGISIVPK